MLIKVDDLLNELQQETNQPNKLMAFLHENNRVNLILTICLCFVSAMSFYIGVPGQETW